MLDVISAFNSAVGYVLYIIGFFLLILTLFAPTLGYSWVYFALGIISGILGLLLIPSSASVLLYLIFGLLVILSLFVLMLALCRENINNWGSGFGMWNDYHCCDDCCDYDKCEKKSKCSDRNKKKCNKSKKPCSSKDKDDHKNGCNLCENNPLQHQATRGLPLSNKKRDVTPMLQQKKMSQELKDLSPISKKPMLKSIKSIHSSSPQSSLPMLKNMMNPLNNDESSVPNSPKSTSTEENDIITLTTTPQKKNDKGCKPIILDSSSPILDKIKKIN